MASCGNGKGHIHVVQLPFEQQAAYPLPAYASKV